jgi:excinuclease ABC subunit A
MDKPDVDYIEGLSPAVSIDQKGASHNPRSTVGTVTEIYDFCACCSPGPASRTARSAGGRSPRQSAQEIVDAVEPCPKAPAADPGPLVRGRKGTHQAVLEEIRKAGFVRARVDGQCTSWAKISRWTATRSTPSKRWSTAWSSARRRPRKPSRFPLAPDRLGRDRPQVWRWLPDRPGCSPARLRHGGNPPTDPRDLYFSEHLSCPVHGVSLPEIEPRTFSFNTPHGACPECQGLGGKLEIDPDLLIPDPDLSLNEGAIVITNGAGRAKKAAITGRPWKRRPDHHIDLTRRCAPSERKAGYCPVRHRGREVTVHYRNRDGRQATFRTPFEGVIPTWSAAIPRPAPNICAIRSRNL